MLISYNLYLYMPWIIYEFLYERSFIYEKQGKKALARKDLEKILATDSDFPGVDQRLQNLEKA